MNAPINSHPADHSAVSAYAGSGWLAGPSFLHPIKRELTPQLVREADVTFEQMGVHRRSFDVRASDGVLLRGWKVSAAKPSGNWALMYHGVADNRMGVLEHARILLLAGYSVVVMDSRAHGASEGAIGPKQMWVVPGAYHTAALGYEPAEFRRRCWNFLRLTARPSSCLTRTGTGVPCPDSSEWEIY